MLVRVFYQVNMLRGLIVNGNHLDTTKRHIKKVRRDRKSESTSFFL